MRTELKIELLLFTVTLLLKTFFDCPEFLMGFLLGLALCFELVGILPEKTYQKLKRVKKSVFDSCRLLSR